LDCIATPNNVGYKIRFSLLLQLLLILILFSSILSLEILSLEMRSESRYVRNALATDGTKRRNKGNRMPQLLEIDRNNGGEDEDGESSSIEIVDDDFEEQVKQNAKRRAIQSSAKEQTKAKKKKRQKKRQGPLSWVSHTIEFVPYDYVKLNQTAKSTIDARKKADGLAFQEPTEMVRCLLASLPSQKVGHSEYALKSQTSNYKRHLDSFHPDCVTWMEKAFEEDANPSALATSFKHFVSTKSRQPPTPGKITNLFPLIKKSKSLNPTYRKELSFLVWMIEAENSFHGIDLESFKTMKKEMNAGLRSRRTLMKLLGAIYAVALESMERVISKCGFFSTTFDYWHGQGEDFLGVTYHTCQHDFVLRSFVLDLVYTPGRKFISNVYIQVKQCIETHTSIESLHAASVTDRAKNVLGASAMLVGDEDAEKCINHEIKSIIDDVFCGSDVTLWHLLLQVYSNLLSNVSNGSDHQNWRVTAFMCFRRKWTIQACNLWWITSHDGKANIRQCHVFWHLKRLFNACIRMLIWEVPLCLKTQLLEMSNFWMPLFGCTWVKLSNYRNTSILHQSIYRERSM